MPTLGAIALIFVVALFASPASAATDDAALTRDLAARVQAYVDADRFRGGVLVARDGGVVYESYVGPANDARANDATTLFHVGSISKIFVAASILKLQDEEKLTTRDPVRRFFPEVPAGHFAWPGGREATLADVLHHTSGLRRAEDTALGSRLWADDVPFREQLEAVTARGLVSAPGAAYAYNNFGFVLLAEVVTRTSGEPYPRYLREHVLAPVADARDVAWDGEADLARMARGSLRALGVWWDAERTYGIGARAFPSEYSGNLVATPRALYAWIAALAEGGVLSRAALDEMVAPGLEGYGEGIGIEDRDGWKRIGHTGALTPAGHCAKVDYFVEQRAAVVVLADGDETSVPIVEIARDLRAILQGRAVPAPVVEEPGRKRDEVLFLCLAPGGRAAWARALQAIVLALLGWAIARPSRSRLRFALAKPSYVALALVIALFAGVAPAALAVVALVAIGLAARAWQRSAPRA